MPLLIILASLALTALIAVLSHGHVLLVALPLAVGLPLAGWFGRRR